MSAQGGVFARRQAISRGVTPRQFERLSHKGGPWVRVRYGVYTTRETWSSLDTRGHALLRDRAALLMCQPDAVLSHSSAARLLDLPLYAVDDGLSHVTRTGPGQTGRVQAQVKHHMSALDPACVTPVGNVQTTTAERTVVDLSREYGYRTGLVAADAALHDGASRARLLALTANLTTEPFGPVIAAVAMAADGRAQTPIETLSRILLTDMGIDDLELQYVVRFPEGGLADTDLYSPSLNHVFECDGRLKYQDQYDPGGQLITADQVLWLEKKREDKIRGLGIGFSRILWSDTLPRNFEATSTRLWREIEQQGARSWWMPPGA